MINESFLVTRKSSLNLEMLNRIPSDEPLLRLNLGTQNRIPSDEPLSKLTQKKLDSSSDLRNTNSLIINQIQKINLAIQNLSIVKILLQNPYDQLIPFNIWFNHPNYVIKDHFENNQHIRSRFYKELTMTPLVRHTNIKMIPLNKFISQLSMYQPFYPETFFQMYDFLSVGHMELGNKSSTTSNQIKSRGKNILHIGQENRLGSLEAIILHSEKNQQTYLDNVYHTWLSGNESYDMFNHVYNLATPQINYLSQAYDLTFLKSTSELIMYDFVSIDVNHTCVSILKWGDSEELDLHANLFYLLTVLKHLKKSGSVIIKMNLIGLASWNFLMDIASRFFSEYSFFRPSINHPLNSEIYLYLNNFRADNIKSFPTIFDILLMNLYKQNMHEIFCLNPFTKNNDITDKYIIEVNKWINLTNRFVENVTESIPNQKCDVLLKKLDLVSVKELTKEIEIKAVMQSLYIPSSKSKFKIKPYTPNELYKTDSYQNLVKQKSKLNYYKRVMDTKPSKIFDSFRFNSGKGNDLVTWEELTSKTDLYKKLRHLLRDQYKVELLTNAWIKMFEMLNFIPDLVLPIVSPESEDPPPKLKTFHLCEAPGAFISALNYFLASRSVKKWEWYSQTLRKINDTDTALDDDFDLIKSHPANWIFGDSSDDSGDITHSAVIKAYAQNKSLQNIDFMTADAGIQIPPKELNEQESKLAKINMGQIICILACLSKGKNAIFKTFLPMTEPLTISMMYLLTHLFESVSIIKPIGSRGCNSEIYVVLKNYSLIKKSDLNILYNLLDDPLITSTSVLFDFSDNKLFMESYVACVTTFIDRQIKYLHRNYYYYYNYETINELYYQIENYTKRWSKTNPITIPKKLLLQ